MRSYPVVYPYPEAARTHIYPKVPRATDMPLGEEVAIGPDIELELKLELKIGRERRCGSDEEPSLAPEAVG